jgi:ADP-heptose:LPS heptosyltransferase
MTEATIEPEWKKKGHLPAGKKLLAINFGGIGDEILFLPFLKTVRANYPEHEICLLLEPRSKSVAEITDTIDKIKTFDIKKRPLLVSDLIDLLGIIKEGEFDLVVSSGSSPLVSLLLFLSGIKERIGYDSGLFSWIFLTSVAPLNRFQYAANMYHDLALGLGLSDPPKPPQIVVSEQNVKRVRSLLNGGTTGSGSKVVVIHPGASRLSVEKGIIKTWAVKNWVYLINKLLGEKNIHVVIAGGPDDQESITEILAQLDGQSKKRENGSQLTNFYGKTKSLADLAALINLSDLLICVDSAPMHLGVALNKNLIALFGPTEPKKLLPQDSRFTVIKANDIGQGDYGKAGELAIVPNVVWQTVLNKLSK